MAVFLRAYGVIGTFGATLRTDGLLQARHRFVDIKIGMSVRDHLSWISIISKILISPTSDQFSPCRDKSKVYI